MIICKDMRSFSLITNSPLTYIRYKNGCDTQILKTYTLTYGPVLHTLCITDTHTHTHLSPVSGEKCGVLYIFIHNNSTYCTASGVSVIGSDLTGQ